MGNTLTHTAPEHAPSEHLPVWGVAVVDSVTGQDSVAEFHAASPESAVIEATRAGHIMPAPPRAWLTRPGRHPLAAEVEALRAEVARLREQVEPIARSPIVRRPVRTAVLLMTIAALLLGAVSVGGYLLAQHLVRGQMEGQLGGQIRGIQDQLKGLLP
jgi:outer membrane murein-binding lipoprotein Lpp